MTITSINKTKQIHWKWSTGEKYPQSFLNARTTSDTEKPPPQCAIKINSPNESLIPHSPNQELCEVTFRDQSRREETNHKLSERELVNRSAMNPFMINNDYIIDLDVQDNYLKPKNSSYEEKGI